MGREAAQIKENAKLIAEHRAILTGIGIDCELIAAAGIRSVGDEEARELGFHLSSASDLSGIVFPYHDPETGHRVTARLRRNHPDTDEQGKMKRKYVSPVGDNRHLYFPPGSGTLLADASIPTVIVESEKSALALVALARRKGRMLLVVGTGGCWGWRGKTGIEMGPLGDRRETRGPLPDLYRINWSRRDVIILFDANATTNPHVRTARRALSEEILGHGASVNIAELPQLSGVNGPDDLVTASGDQALLELLDTARPCAEIAEAEAEAAVAALEANKKQDPTCTLPAVAAVAAPLHRTLLIGRIAALRIPGLTKKVIEAVTAEEGSSLREKQSQAMEMARRERLVRLPVDPAQLIAELESYYSRRRSLPADLAFVEALFAMNTYTYDAFDTTPYMLYDSATGGCGKTTALERHEHVCARSYLGVDPSAAVLYRRIHRDRPTWLLDEARVLQNHGERGQELLALFDAGYKRGATVSRCEDHGEELRDFTVYCPKALARIGSFRGTLLDRGIVIHLQKARGLRQTRRSVLRKESAPLKEKLEAYALQYRARLEHLYEVEPDEGYWPQLSGREEEVWGPLLYHARLAGPEVEGRAIKVALRFSRQKAEIAIGEDRVLSLAQEALEVLRSREAETFCPSELVMELSEKEIWGEHLAERKSDKARVTAVGTFFRQFRLASRTHTDRGTQYRRLEALEALNRHLPETAVPADEGVKVSAGGTTDSDSAEYLADTSHDQSAKRVSGADGVVCKCPSRPLTR